MNKELRIELLKQACKDIENNAEEKYYGEYSFSNSNKEIINNEISN